MDVKNVLSMTKGDGENSYLHTSIYTQKVASVTQPAIEEAIESLFPDFQGKRLLSVADLGCAAGPNVFLVMSTVISTVDRIFRDLDGSQIPEIQFLLNDLPGNDFNTLFGGLSGFGERNRDVCVPWFVMGASGSFHGRLFPRNSMDLIHSSYSVHWLSQVPKFVSPNKGNIYISKTSPPTVKEAYLAQFQDDFTHFLNARSQEMVFNGRIVLILHGRTSPDSEDTTNGFDTLSKAISLMVSQGLVEEEKLDSFNMPYYTSSKEEVRHLIDNEGSFDIERLELFEIDCQEIWSAGSEDKMADAYSKSIRGYTEAMISHHFGQEMADELYDKFIKMVFLDQLTDEPVMVASIIVTLRRKMLTLS